MTTTEKLIWATQQYLQDLEVIRELSKENPTTTKILERLELKTKKELYNLIIYNDSLVVKSSSN